MANGQSSRCQGIKPILALLPAFKRDFLGVVYPSNKNFPTSPSCASSSKLGSPSLLALEIDCFCSYHALILGTAQPSSATLQCQPGSALQRASTPQQLVPAPTAPGRAACLGAILGRSRDGNGKAHCVISDSPVATGSCCLMSPATSHSRQLSSLAPFYHSTCHPKGKGTLGTPITPEWGETATSSLSCHSYGSALMCHRDQFSV